MFYLRPLADAGNTSSAAAADIEREDMDVVDHLLVTTGRQDTSRDNSLLDVYMTQPTSKDLSTLDAFPLIKKLFIKTNTLLPSSAPAEASN